MIVQAGTRETVLSDYLKTHAHLMVLDLDQDGVVIEANRYARANLGSDCVGKPFADLIIDFHNSFSLEELRTQDNGTLMSFKTGNNYPVSMKIQYLPLHGGGLIIGEQNLDESLQLHTSLMRLNSELNTVSRDLQKKTVQLEQANNLKNQFLGIATHDLRSPLATVYAYIDLLRDDMDIDSNRPLFEAMGLIQHELKYMMNLVANLLDISVIEQGRLVLDKQPVSIRQLVSQAVQTNQLLSAKRNINILMQAVETDVEMMADPFKIRQVLNNLISNAVKYSPSDTTVTVAVETGAASGCCVRITDQGPGIPEDKRNRLFVPFGKTDQQSFSGEKSTGLGLAICRKIIEAHGGSIGMENAPCCGSSFWFTLPLPTAD